MNLRLPNVSGSGLLKMADRMVFFAFVSAVVAVYILDMIFFGSLVEFGWLTLVFVLIGIVFRTVAVASGVFLQKFKKGDGNHAARTTMRVLWVACVAACLLSAINFFAAGHSDKEQSVTMVEATNTASIETKAERITKLEAQKTEIGADLASSVASVARAMAAIEDDGVPGIPEKDLKSLSDLRVEEKGYRDQARTDRQAVEDKIEAIRNEKDVATVDGASVAEQDTTWAVFVWLGDHTFLGQDAWSNSGLFYLAMLIEAIAALGLGAYVALKRPYMRTIVDVAIEEDIADIHHESELASARIRALALKRKLAREAEAEAAILMGDYPDMIAAVSAVNALAGLARHEEASDAPQEQEPETETKPEETEAVENTEEKSEETVAQEPQQEDEPEPETKPGPKVWGAWGGRAAAMNAKARDAVKVPVSDRSTLDIGVTLPVGEPVLEPAE